MATIKFKRGLKAALPTTGMSAGEHFFTTDRKSLHIAHDATTQFPVVPPLDDLTTLASVNGATDFLLMHDADGVGIKEKKILFNDFKTALAIPAASTDEKTAVVSGGTPGYLYGTNGTDGVLRVSSALSLTKDGGNGFMTVDVATIDCGTF